MVPKYSIDETVARLLAQADKANMPDLKTLPLDEARAQYALNARLMGGPQIEVESVLDRSITVDGRSLPVRVYRPDARTPAPALVYLHGGGWVVGNLDSHDNLCRSLAAQSACAVVAVDYRLAPEHKFPAALEDAVGAYAWVKQNGAKWGIDTQSVAIGGDSAGGSLAAVVSHLSSRADAPGLLLLFYPSTDMTMSCSSIRELASGYRLTEDLIRWFVDQYLGDPKHSLDPRASPILIQDLEHMPRTLLVTAGFDPLRDEGTAFADKLAAAGVQVEHHCYEGMIHGFMNMSGALPQARAAVSQAAATLRAALT